jgi:hypothetical protein
MFSAEDGIAANEAMVVAVKAAAKAEADLVVIAAAEAVAAKGGTLSGADITAVIHAVFVVAPEQPCTRSSLAGKAKGLEFLAALPTPWAALLVPARAACVAASEAATAAKGAAAAAIVAAVADHQPPAAPSVVATGATTAAGVDLAAMSEADKRALLAQLHASMAVN